MRCSIACLIALSSACGGATPGSAMSPTGTADLAITWAAVDAGPFAFQLDHITLE